MVVPKDALHVIFQACYVNTCFIAYPRTFTFPHMEGEHLCYMHNLGIPDFNHRSGSTVYCFISVFPGFSTLRQHLDIVGCIKNK